MGLSNGAYYSCNGGYKQREKKKKKKSKGQCRVAELKRKVGQMDVKETVEKKKMQLTT